MPHLLKEYSKNLGVEPVKPFVNKHFYPIQADKYFVIYNEQEVKSKSYFYYEIVINLIKKVLSSRGYKIVVIGSSENLISNADYHYPNLSFRKNCYIISKAEAFVSIDNALTQYAGSCGIPIVNLYGNIYPSITTSYWSNKKNKIDLCPEWDKKPCLSTFDPKDSINEILVEDVALSILNVLGFSDIKELNFKTKRKNKAKFFQLDIIPTKYINLPQFRNRVLNLRLDQGVSNDEAVLSYCSNHNCNLILKDQLLTVDSLKTLGNNVRNIFFIATEVPEKIPETYFELTKRLNINFVFLVRDKSILDEMRIEYFDQDVEYQDHPKEKPNDIDINDKFISFKTVIDGDKVYNSLAHWQKKIDFGDNILDNLSYWEELDYFYIYEQDRIS